MTFHLHHLYGCAPAPLACYLKALGVLRILAKQRDPEVWGFWKDEHFCLVTSLDATDIEKFFLKDYAPTAFLSPWNKGSGFFATKDPALTPIEQSTAERFAPYREGIKVTRKQLNDISDADAVVRQLKAKTKGPKGASNAAKVKARALRDDPTYKAELAAAERRFKKLKGDLVTQCALDWRSSHRDWMDAAMVLADDTTPVWPSLLGTGGNDGRLDFTNNAMQRLNDLFDVESTTGAPRNEASTLLRNSLWAAPANHMSSAAVGQYLPGSAGGANGTTGPGGDAFVNPWDFVLMLEGAVLFRALTTKRLSAQSAGKGAVPFAVHAHAAGYATAGREKTERGEQWMPLWNRPATVDDVAALFGEGRAQLGRSTAQRPIDFARAIARLGTARGLTGFVRYAYLERNGQSKIAVPLGTIAVGERPRARLIDDIAPWLDRLQRLVGKGDAPTRLSVVEGRLADAVFNALLQDDTPSRWQSVLLAIAAVERVQVVGTGFEVGPCPALSAEWLEAAREDSAEWRLAEALGSACTKYNGRHPVEPIRVHALPLDRLSRYETSDKRLVKNPRIVMTGRDAIGDLIAVVERRLIEGSQRGQRRIGLQSAVGRGAMPSDLAELLAGRVDLNRTVNLARALMAVKWSTVKPASSLRGDRRLLGPSLDPGWMALRLCGLPFDVDGRKPPMDLGAVRRLASGDVARAVAAALRRLEAVGYRLPIRTATTARARLWAAALAFPIDRTIAQTLARRFDRSDEKESA